MDVLTYVSSVRTIVRGVVLAECAARASAAPPTSRAEGEGALIAIPLAHSPDTSRSLLPEPPLDGAAGDAAISGIANVRAAVPPSMSYLAAKLDEFMRTHFRLSGTVPREGRVSYPMAAGAPRWEFEMMLPSSDMDTVPAWCGVSLVWRRA